jgi:biopolymer transport protein ExbB/TolQ
MINTLFGVTSFHKSWRPARTVSITFALDGGGKKEAETLLNEGAAKIRADLTNDSLPHVEVVRTNLNATGLRYELHIFFSDPAVQSSSLGTSPATNSLQGTNRTTATNAQAAAKPAPVQPRATNSGAPPEHVRLLSKPIVQFNQPVPLLSLEPADPPLVTIATFHVNTGISAQSFAKVLNAICQKGPYGDKSLAPPEETLRQYVFRMEELFTKYDITTRPRVIWLRRINGLIQFCALWFFATFVVAAILRYMCLVMVDGYVAREGKRLDARLQRANHDDAAVIAALDKEQKVLKEKSEICGSWLQSPLLEMYKQALLGYRVGGRNISQVGTQVRIAAEGFLERNYSSGAFLRYLLWAVPTIGFVGTVVGIGYSLLLTNQLQSTDDILRELGRSRVNTNIAVAFDTTFVGLILSLIGMYIFGALTDHEETIVHRHSHEIIQTLATLKNADPSEPQIDARVPEYISPAPSAPKEASHRPPRIPVWSVAVGVVVVLWIIVRFLGWLLTEF